MKIRQRTKVVLRCTHMVRLQANSKSCSEFPSYNHLRILHEHGMDDCFLFIDPQLKS